MVGEVRVYVEGGGDHRHTRAAMRRGFGMFLDGPRQAARARRIRWRVVACGGRANAFDTFRRALRTHPDSFNVLLVDSEGPVATPPVEHLAQRDRWDLSGLDDDQCHLMVQTTEAWLIADPEGLADFYGQGFNAAALPPTADVETIPKAMLLDSLARATRGTAKGPYHKTRHAPDLLGVLDPAKVRRAARHCHRLLSALDQHIQA